MKLTHSTIKFFILLVLLVVICLAALLMGSKSISLVSLFESAELPAGRVLWQHRMPHVLGAIVVGSSLALSGNYMQVIFRNPLAGPSVLGITGGASLAMAVIFLTSWGMNWFLNVGTWALFIPAFAGAMLVLSLLLVIQRKLPMASTLLVVGLLFSHFTGAIESILQKMAGANNVNQFVVWGMGSLDNLTLSQLPWLFLGAFVPFIPTFYFLRKLNAFAMGEQIAATSGVDVVKLRWVFLISVGISTATITAFCGPIAFIGLMAPHVARLFIRSFNQQHLIYFIPLVGAILLVISDLISRLYALPLNAITAAIGIPCVFYIVFNPKRSGVWMS
jgi:iron complex transport system permease protein